MQRYKLDPEDFRTEITELDEEALARFVSELSEYILELEAEDFFGPEGINKRFRV